MANLKGEGAFQNVSLIVKLPAKGMLPGKDGKSDAYFLEVQVDQSLKNPDKVASGEAEADTNPYLVSYTKEHPSGGEYTSHRDKYWGSQFDAIVKAATDPNPKNPKSPHNTMFETENGDKIYGITANLTKNAHGNLIIDTRGPMERTRNPRFGKNVLARQEAVTEAARVFREQMAEKTAPEKTVEAEMDAPEV